VCVAKNDHCTQCSDVNRDITSNVCGCKLGYRDTAGQPLCDKCK